MKKFLVILILTYLYTPINIGAEINKVDSLITALHSTKDDTAKVMLLYELCSEYGTSNSDKVMNYAKRGLIIAQQLENPDMIASGLSHIGTAYRIKYDYAQAMQYHFKALNIYKIFNSQIAMGWVYVELGNDYYWQSNYTYAAEYYQKALAVFKKSGFKHGIAVCFNNLGMICEKQGEYFKAIDCYMKASDNYEGSGNKEGTAWCLELVANIYLHQNNYSNAMKYYIMSLKIYEELNDKKGIALSYNNLGSVHEKQGNYSGALEYFLKALNIFEQLGIKHKIASTSSLIGNVYAKSGEAHPNPSQREGLFNKALNYQEKSLGIQENISDKNGMVLSLTGIGNTLNKSGKSRDAIKYLQKSVAIAKELGMKTALSDAYKYLSAAYFQINDYQKAYHYHQKYAGLKDSLYDEKTSAKIAEMQTIYETGKKEKEIELLTKEKKIQSLELKKNNIMVYALCGAFGFVMLLTFVIYRALCQKQNINKKLVRNAEERTLELSKSNEDIQTEITGRKNAVNAMNSSEQKYRALIESMNDGVIQVNKDDIIQFVNEQFCKMSGYSKDELLGNKSANLFLNGNENGNGKDKIFMGEFKSVSEKGSSAQNIVKLKKKDSEFIRIMISGSTDYDEGKNAIGSTGVVTDISKILEYKENLEKINSELSTFIYKASHDLMGPLSSSIGVVNLCKQNINDKNVISYLDLISLSLDKLKKILSDLSEIILIRQGKTNIIPVKIKPLLDDIVQTFIQYPGFDKTKVIINNKLRSQLKSDIELLSIILRNLFENALKYRKIGAKNSFIKITTGRTTKNITIAVSDNGIGIPKEHHQDIYNMFVRATTMSSGSGLGLYSVKNAVEKLKGTIKLKSKEKVGSTFTIYLPNHTNHN